MAARAVLAPALAACVAPSLAATLRLLEVRMDPAHVLGERLGDRKGLDDWYEGTHQSAPLGKRPDIVVLGLD